MAQLARHRLGRKHLVAQIDGQAVIPVLGRQLVQRMAVIPPGVVDKHLHRAELLVDPLQQGLQRGDITDVTGFVIGRWVASRCDFTEQPICAARTRAAQRNPAALRRKCAHQLGSNAG